MKVQANHGKVTQNMHGASRNYRYVWDLSAAGCRRKKRSKGKATATAPGVTASSEPMTPGAADCTSEAPIPREKTTDPEASASAEQVTLGAADCEPGAVVVSSEIDTEMKEAPDVEVE